MCTHEGDVLVAREMLNVMHALMGSKRESKGRNLQREERWLEAVWNVL